MRRIPLTNSSLFALIDDEDYLLITNYSWWLRGKTFQKLVVTEIDNKEVQLHRLILIPKNNFIIDHINRNKLDNQKNNLRYVTALQNAHNRSIKINNTSGYKGVTSRFKVNKWEARIMYNYKPYKIGLFNTKEEAALAYNIKAKELFGEYAYLNIIKENIDNKE